MSDKPSSETACRNDTLPPRDNEHSPDEVGITTSDRRSFFVTASGVAMTGGLVASYGTFAYMAADFLYPTDRGTAWMFVAQTNQIAPGGSFSFRSPTGLAVLITRKADSPQNVVPPASDFLALSSVCPHLGCRVHWEPQNERFFCPCHNGAFDPGGAPIAGPPKDGNQHLPRYPLMVNDRGLLFIEMPAESLVEPDRNIALSADGGSPIVRRVRAHDCGEEIA